ncbi:hypothetical protein [Aurantimicrobium minutum]|uniref:hypothetical protein n=1 Tax=Aurantimicrobium minutum TaxID=708131 RepID=UPI00248D7F31|nr:hypothetical protein [Aurantimicrobium minutum]
MNEAQKPHHRDWANKVRQDLGDVSVIRTSSFMGVHPWLHDVLTTLYVGLNAAEITETFVSTEELVSGNQEVRMLLYTSELVALLKVEIETEANHLPTAASLSLQIEPKTSLLGMTVGAHGDVLAPENFPDWVRQLNVTLRYPSFEETIPYDPYSTNRGIEKVQQMIPSLLQDLKTYNQK